MNLKFLRKTQVNRQREPVLPVFSNKEPRTMRSNTRAVATGMSAE
jgi:hypothetical protein